MDKYSRPLRHNAHAHRSANSLTCNLLIAYNIDEGLSMHKPCVKGVGGCHPCIHALTLAREHIAVERLQFNCGQGVQWKGSK